MKDHINSIKPYQYKSNLMKMLINNEKKLLWAITRSILETDKYKHKKYREKSKSHWDLFKNLTHLFGYCLKFTGLYQKGFYNAQNIVVNRIELDFENLPLSFKGYRILHLTDLHLDCYEGIDRIISSKISEIGCDICVMTGDYREKTHGGFKPILKPMERIASSIKAEDGIFAVLGNHDSYLMVDYMENIGIKVLTNETLTINKGGDQVAITGIDDPHYYFTDQAIVSMQEDIELFKILLVHSPELYDIAAENNYNLYLCGHTHGGQICLPGGLPLITHLSNGRKYYRGLWKHYNMLGYTGQGCGVVSIPVRFNCESEITLITLNPK